MYQIWQQTTTTTSTGYLLIHMRQTPRRNEDGFPINNEASPSGLPTQTMDVTSTQCLLFVEEIRYECLLFVLLEPDCAKLGRLHPSVSTYKLYRCQSTLCFASMHTALHKQVSAVRQITYLSRN